MGHTILVVEDDDDIRSLAELLLAGSGYATIPARSGEDGIRLLEQHPVDLVLLDINLPGIKGWEVCRQLRADPRFTQLPILVFTAQNARQDQGNWELVNGCINKPFERDVFLAAVASLLQ